MLIVLLFSSVSLTDTEYLIKRRKFQMVHEIFGQTANCAGHDQSAPLTQEQYDSTLLHSEEPKLHGVLAVLSAIELSLHW